jgi:hypothetical protein
MPNEPEGDVWRRQLKEIRSRLLRPERLNQEEIAKLRAEYLAIEKIVKTIPQP